MIFEIRDAMLGHVFLLYFILQREIAKYWKHWKVFHTSVLVCMEKTKQNKIPILFPYIFTFSRSILWFWIFPSGVCLFVVCFHSYLSDLQFSSLFFYFFFSISSLPELLFFSSVLHSVSSLHAMHHLFQLLLHFSPLFLWNEKSPNFSI